MGEEPAVDAVYEAFCGRLPGELASFARGLPAELGLTPTRAIGWSEAFKHEITLAAPRLFSEAMRVPAEAIDRASHAHFFAVVEAFCVDRVEDGQIPSSPRLLALLDCLRAECDDALERLLPGAGVGAVQRAARLRALRAVKTERLLLGTRAAADLGLYESISAMKQEVAFAPSEALARAAGWEPRRCAAVVGCLRSAALGLQTIDDLFDWEDDWRSGGAWAAALAGTAGGLFGAPLADVRRQVFARGVLEAMALRAAKHFLSCSRRAGALGAVRLATWAAEQHEQALAIGRSERRSAGRALRRRALQGWMTEAMNEPG